MKRTTADSSQVEVINPQDALISSEDFKRLAVDKDFRLETLRRGLTMTRDGLTIAARVFTIMEKCGDEIPKEVTPAMAHIFRRISEGITLPEVFLRFRLQPSQMKAISNFPIAEQKRIVEDESILLVVPGEKDLFTTMKVRSEDLSSFQWRQVLNGDGLRDEAAQRAWLEDVKTKASIKPGKPAEEVVLDRKRNGIIVNGIFIPRADLAEYLAKLSR